MKVSYKKLSRRVSLVIKVREKRGGLSARDALIAGHCGRGTFGIVAPFAVEMLLDELERAQATILNYRAACAGGCKEGYPCCN